MDIQALLPPLFEAAHKAAVLVEADSARPKVVTHKADGSPATPTDAAAERIIVEAIRAQCAIPIVAEEEFEAGLTPKIDPDGAFFLVDALDGTRDFIRGGQDFTVNIALVDRRVPVLGIIIAPALHLMWHAIAGQGAFRNSEERISVRTAEMGGIRLLGGKKAAMPEVLEPFVGAHTVSGREQRSSSLKFCLLAEGQADLYPRVGETCEWDTAAGDIILREAGGTVLDIETGKPIVYGKQDQRFINRGFIAGNRNTFLPRI
ncbi:MAG: 3'(2'),5'-bisphosphate nucleotidase CysQ [Alphaproteobacteria bacterium]|nr:3'(2'),5'-bisphosphate nucleotidase CysQ [Alphaproteobacteria bacterium]